METKQYHFLDFLKEYDIVFPIIQRDYAQGRNSAHPTEVRKQFVKELCNVLLATGNSSQLQLDFIYGTIKESKDNNSKPMFIPLDGQQRLTTLFLLHWYVFYLDSVNFGPQGIDSPICFSYETRDYAKEFCKCMCECFSKDGKTTFPSSLERNRQISEIIKDQNWFQAIWEEDPTVNGMLVMLDAIEEELKTNHNDTNLKWNLNNITFYVLPLEDNFALADDLYVKMNARGLGLTNFENFKASLIKQLDDDAIDKKFSNPFKENIDTKWTNLFWKTINKAKKEKQKSPQPAASADDEMMRFVRMVLSFEYAIRNTEYSEDVEKTFRSILVNASGKNAIPIEQFTYFKLHDDLQVLKKEDVEFLIEAFKQIGSLFDDDDGNFLEQKLQQQFVDVYGELKKFVLDEKPGYDNQLMILGIIYACQLDKHQNQWLRLMRNLIKNTITDSQEKMFKAIQELNQLKDKFIICAKNNSWDDLLDECTHFSSQGEEEIAKFKIITSLGTLKQRVEITKKIFEYEKCDYFEGRIKFLLLWSGCSSVNIKDISNFKDTEFKKYGDNIVSLFQKEESDPYFIERLLLSTKLNNHKYVYPYQYEDWKIGKKDLQFIDINGTPITIPANASIQQYSFANLKNDRDYSWKRLLNDNPADYRGKNSQRDSSLADCQELFKQICKSSPSSWLIPTSFSRRSWQDILIKNKRKIKIGKTPIEYCSKSVFYIYVDNGKERVFLSQQGIGKLHYKSSNPCEL